MTTDYESFLASKLAVALPQGIDVDANDLHPRLFPHQRDIVRWSLRRGRAAIFADTGLGKTAMQLECGRHIAMYTRMPTLILTPLAVAAQTVREAASMDVQAVYARDAQPVYDGWQCIVTNYDRLHLFDPCAFGGVILDESSVLKDHTAAKRTALIEAFAPTPFRLACTATPAPNDYTELGNHAEFLGVCKRTEMLATYFYHDGGDTSKWLLKRHAKDAFWRWVASWAVMVKRPSDLGYPDDGYALPELRMFEHVLASDVKAQREATPKGKTVSLFVEAAPTLTAQRQARRVSLDARVTKAAELIAAESNEAWIVWADLNIEGDELERALKNLVPGAIQIAGSDPPEFKESMMLGFTRNEPLMLITKPSIAGYGMNWQHCARMIFIGATHSYEKWKQAKARCHRFGQRREVHCHLITTEAEGRVLENLRRKEAEAEAMSTELVKYVRSFVRAVDVNASTRTALTYAPKERMRLPEWL